MRGILFEGTLRALRELPPPGDDACGTLNIELVDEMARMPYRTAFVYDSDALLKTEPRALKALVETRFDNLVIVPELVVDDFDDMDKAQRHKRRAANLQTSVTTDGHEAVRDGGDAMDTAGVAHSTTALPAASASYSNRLRLMLTKDLKVFLIEKKPSFIREPHLQRVEEYDTEYIAQNDLDRDDRRRIIACARYFAASLLPSPEKNIDRVVIVTSDDELRCSALASGLQACLPTESMPPRRNAAAVAAVATSPRSAHGARSRATQRRKAAHKGRTPNFTTATHNSAALPATAVGTRTAHCPRKASKVRGKAAMHATHESAAHKTTVISLDRLRALARPVDMPPALLADFDHLAPAAAAASPPLCGAGELDDMSTAQHEHLYGNEEDEEERPEWQARTRLVAPHAIDFDPRDAEDEEATAAARSAGTTGAAPSLPSPLDTDAEEDEAATAVAQRRLTMMRLRAAQTVPLQPPRAPPPVARRQRQPRLKRANPVRGSRGAAAAPQASMAASVSGTPMAAAVAPKSLAKRSLSVDSGASNRRRQYRRVEVIVDHVAIPVPRSCQRGGRVQECGAAEGKASQAYVGPAAATAPSASPARKATAHTPPDPPTPLTPSTAALAPFARPVASAIGAPSSAHSHTTRPGRKKTANVVKETVCMADATLGKSDGQRKGGATPVARHVVFDTSSLLHGEPGVLNLLKEKAVICIPFTVIDELDRLNKDTMRGKTKLSEEEKTERQWRTKRAREVRNWVTAGLKRKDGMMRLQKRAEVIDAYDRNAKNNDDAILGFAVYLARERHNVLFVSEDKFLRIKAETELGRACSIADIKKMLHVRS